ncbi:MAG: dienelactone hydrolase family protein [Pirellulales bacterium]|nr:dienelactone hydrolase family protein [Pirellulales bacterium]
MRRWNYVDWILFAVMGLAIVLLAGSLGWPLVERWQQRGRPGRQVARRFVESVEGDAGKPVPVQMDYLLYLPEDYATKDTWPLVVFLHGAGERGGDVARVARGGPPRMVNEGHSFPFIMICPQCAAERNWEPDEVLSLVEHICGDWPVDRERVYLMGYSMGAFGAWRTAAAAPGRFAAMVPIAGGGDAEQASRLVNLPIWAFHGGKDNTVALESCQATIEAVKAAGGNAKLTVYKNAGHGILDRVCDDPGLWFWLLSQQCGKTVQDGPVKSGAKLDPNTGGVCPHPGPLPEGEGSFGG